MYNFDELLERRNTDCTKWDAIERDYGKSNLMPFWVADADFPVLPEIGAAIAKRSGEGQTFGYTFAGESFFTSVIEWNKRRHSMETEKKEIIPVPGVVTGIALALMALTKEGDRVLINTPVYGPFFSVVRNLKRTLQESRLIQKDHVFTMDFEDIESKFKEGTKAMIFCSPHNPVGRVWTRRELETLGGLCRKYGVLLISDEIHSDIVYRPAVHIPILNVYPDAVLINSPSKSFNVAGLKGSLVFIKNEAIRKQYSDLVNSLHLYVNLFSLLTTETVYTKGEQWLEDMIEYVRGNAGYVLSYTEEHLGKAKAYMPESTYLLWLDFSGYGLTDKELEAVVEDEAGLAMNPGTDYGEPYGQYMRLNIACPRFYLEKGMERLGKAFLNK